MKHLSVSEICIGCGLCVASNDRYFAFNDEGFCSVKKEIVEDGDVQDVENIADSCPAEAILLEDAEPELHHRRE